MKKILLGSSFVMLAMITLTSCKKDYTCACTVSGPGITTETTTSVINGTKSDVKEACESGTTTVGTLSYNCVIQ